MSDALYEDRWISCLSDRLVIRGYYFPFLMAKTIAYRQILQVGMRDLTLMGGRWRIWGTSDPRFWFHLDPQRPHKQKALILDTGHWVKPVITPDDPDLVAGIIEQRRRPMAR